MPTEKFSGERESGEKKLVQVEKEPSSDTKLNLPFDFLQKDLQQNYTDHLKSIEQASLGILDGVIRSTRIGFQTSLVLNVLSFILGLGVIITGLVIFIQSPENFGKVVGALSSVGGLILIISLLFWKGPLDRILASVADLARINVITIGLAHRLNQVSRVFVQDSLRGKMNVKSLQLLNKMIEDAVTHSVDELSIVLPKHPAEDQVQDILTSQSDITKDG
jgi:hypothetical protein